MRGARLVALTVVGLAGALGAGGSAWAQGAAEPAAPAANAPAAEAPAAAATTAPETVDAAGSKDSAIAGDEASDAAAPGPGSGSSTKAGMIRIGRQAGAARVRKPGGLRYMPIKRGVTVPPGSVLCLDATLFQSEPKAFALDDQDRRLNLTGEQCVTLTNAAFGTKVEGVGARDQKDVGLPLAALDHPATGGRKILMFLTGSNSDVGRLGVPTETLAKKARLTPIIPLYPPVVKVIETTTLPVTVTLEWPVFPGQAEPHKVFLWSDRISVYTPWQTVTGGTTVVMLGSYGKYYWHIEDADARHASAPRTVIVRPPLTRAVTIKTDKGDEVVTRIGIREPAPNTLLTGCVDQSSVTASVVFDNPAETATVFRVAVEPSGSLLEQTVTAPGVGTGAAKRFGFARLKLIAPADGELRVLAFHDKDAKVPVAASEPIPFRTARTCGAKQIAEVLGDALKGEVLPAEGGVRIGWDD